jgi:hypothetical protein
MIVRQIENDILGLGFGFLETQDIGLVVRNEWIKHIFTQHGANAVYIPGVHFHGGKYILWSWFAELIAGDKVAGGMLRYSTFWW